MFAYKNRKHVETKYTETKDLVNLMLDAFSVMPFNPNSLENVKWKMEWGK